jgi:hypothetical protein
MEHLSIQFYHFKINRKFTTFINYNYNTHVRIFDLLSNRIKTRFRYSCLRSCFVSNSFGCSIFFQRLETNYTFNNSFTIGHTVALLLSVFGIIAVKVNVVELLIPITILITAFFNLFTAGKSNKKKYKSNFFCHSFLGLYTD